jgi:immune inhibitor A
MANDAFEAAIESAELDLEAYDNDDNGYVRTLISSTLLDKVDAFVVVHAGQGAEETGDAGDLWSVKWTLPKTRETGGQYHPNSVATPLTHL